MDESARQLLVKESNKYVVAASELPCAEYCFKVLFNCFRHPKYNENIHKLDIIINALGSSAGGVVMLCREPGQNLCVKPNDIARVKERLKTWLLSRNSNIGADRLHFVHVAERMNAWALILVEASIITSQINVDDEGLIVHKDSSHTKSKTASTTPTSATARVVETDKATGPVPEAVPTITDSDIQSLLGDKISWTTHKRNWEDHVVLDEACSWESNVRQYGAASEIFVPSDPIIFSPSHVFNIIFPVPSDRIQVKLAIKERLDSPKAFAIVSPSWLSHIGMEEAAERQKAHVCDILLVSEKGGIYLWTFVKYAAPLQNIDKAYMMIAGRLTKSLLMKAQHPKCMLRVDCYLYNLEDGNVEEPQLQQYTRSAFVNNSVPLYIQKTLAEMIVTGDTYMKNVIGQTCSYKLSVEQCQVISQRANASVFLIEGPPGSGKMLLCVHCLQEKGSKRECLYVCTNHELGAFMESQNMCSVEVVKTDAQLTRMIERGGCHDKTCIAFDDAHRFSCSDRTIKRLLKLVRETQNIQLYIFYDQEFQCFDEVKKPFYKAVGQCCRSMSMKYESRHLAEVHRNTRRIMSFLSAVSFKGRIKCLNRWEGDNVEVLASENPLLDSSDNTLVQNITQLLRLSDPDVKRLSCWYAPTDITILIDTSNPTKDVSQCQRILRKYIPSIDIHSASTYPRTGIVVDCLDSFHGLDSGVCFYILSLDRIEKRGSFSKRESYSGRTVYNCKYLAFLASRAIHKAVFMVPRLDLEVFKALLFDSFGEKVITCSTHSLLC